MKTNAEMQKYLLTTALDRGGYSDSRPSHLGPGYPPNWRLGTIHSQPESLASSGKRTTIPQTANSYSTHYTGCSIPEVKNYSAFYEIQRFNAALTRASH
jgi:hypothetical protein